MPTSAPTNALDTASSTVVLASGSIFIDHATIELARIPTEWLEAAKRDVVWLYGRTSHGSQLVTGANCLSERVEPQVFNFLTEWGKAIHSRCAWLTTTAGAGILTSCWGRSGATWTTRPSAPMSPRSCGRGAARCRTPVPRWMNISTL